MTEKDIRPIPKYILKLIQKIDKLNYPMPDGHVRFYSYLTSKKGELIKVTVAVKHRYKNWYYKQVAIHGLHSENCYVKDLEYCGMAGMGFRVGWYDEGLQKYRNWFESKDWCYAQDKYYDPYAPLINKDYISRFMEFKYSAYELYYGNDIFRYLRLYEQYPQMEMLMKFGFTRIAQSKTILKLTGKDRSFCKWLISNKEQLQSKFYYNDVIVKAYKTNRPIDKLQSYKSAKLQLQHDNNLSQIKELFKGKELERFFDYISFQDTNPHTYLDYVKACQYLGLDISIDKNRFPHNFKRWHDIRIDEYATKKALEDAEKKKELYAKFASVAEKYMALEKQNSRQYIAIIAQSPADLINEGEVLHHCVGRMNYDQRFIREESLIFFIRNKQTPNTPFVTVEYSLKTRKVLQCYGDHDSKPDDDILHYVNKIWLPYANKTLKKIPA